MTPTEIVFASVVSALSAGGGTMLFRFVTRSEDRRKSEAETLKIAAETARTTAEAYALPFQQALEFIAELKAERGTLRARVTQLEELVEEHEKELRSYRRLLEAHDIAIPP